MELTDSNLKLDHVGVQVRQLEPAIRMFEELFGYRQATDPVWNASHEVEVVFLEKPGSLPIKLFRPTNTGGNPPPKLHHLAFRATDIEREVVRLKGKGARVLSPPTRAEAFDDSLVAFLFAGGLNIEIISSDRRRARRPLGGDSTT